MNKQETISKIEALLSSVDIDRYDEVAIEEYEKEASIAGKTFKYKDVMKKMAGKWNGATWTFKNKMRARLICSIINEQVLQLNIKLDEEKRLAKKAAFEKILTDYNMTEEQINEFTILLNNRCRHTEVKLKSFLSEIAHQITDENVIKEKEEKTRLIALKNEERRQAEEDRIKARKIEIEKMEAQRIVEIAQTKAAQKQFDELSNVSATETLEVIKEAMKIIRAAKNVGFMRAEQKQTFRAAQNVISKVIKHLGAINVESEALNMFYDINDNKLRRISKIEYDMKDIATLTAI